MRFTSKLHLHAPVYVATSKVRCWKCHKPTPVHALYAANVEDFEPGEGPWCVEAETFVFEVPPQSLPSHVVEALSRVAPNFKPTYSRTVGASSWADVCVHCQMLQGAFFLHEEPDGPFFAGREDFKGAKTLVSERGFDVEGASYSM